MKKSYFILFLLIFSSLSFCQEITEDTIQFKYLQKIEYNLLGLGVNYEAPLNKVLILDTGLGLNAGYTAGNSINFEKDFLNPTFYIKSELKYYYNRPQRIKRGNSTDNNAGSYFAFQTKFSTKRLFDYEDKLSNVLLNEIHWGIQRTIYENVLFNFHVGLGNIIDFTTKGGSNYASLGVRFSYILSKKEIKLW